MSLLRAIARPLLASVFIVDGIDAIRHADAHAESARVLRKPVAALSEKVPAVPQDLKTLTRIAGAVSVGAGVLLATGKAPRVAAAALILVAVPSTIFNNPVWEAKGGEERKRYLGGLMRGAALIGGLVFAAEDREGKPSASWRYQNWQEHRGELADVKAAFKAELAAAKTSA